jgi:ABC-type glycerol-3-phosphate transport system permease component
VQSIFPLVNFLVPLYILMQDFKLTNTYGALIIGYLTFSLPLDIWLLKGFFDGIPPDMEISARLDGASRWRRSSRLPCRLRYPASSQRRYSPSSWPGTSTYTR